MPEPWGKGQSITLLYFRSTDENLLLVAPYYVFTLICIGINYLHMFHYVCSSQSIVGLASTRSFVSSGSHRPRGSAHLLRSTSLPHLLPTYFVDHDGPCLHLYGNGALEMLDTPVQHKQEPVEEILFHFIDFVEITDWLPKLAHTYPHISVSCSTCTM